MISIASFALKHPDYSISQLTRADIDRLQTLFEQCSDFFVMTNGAAASPTAAREEFEEVPEGKTVEDIQAFGLFDRNDILVGTIIAIEHYPDEQTWWVGLMLLAPEQRGKGLGEDFYRAFEAWVSMQGGAYISLCAIAANLSGRQFWQRMGFEVIRKTPPRPYSLKTHEVYVFRRAIDPANSFNIYP